MKRSNGMIVLAAVLWTTVALAQKPLLERGDLLAICGDSITEQKLYSVYMEDYLLMCRPVEQVRASQFGWGGEVAPGFLGRMSNDCLVFSPTAATTFYGMNDGGYSALTDERANKYRDGVRGIVQTFKKAGVKRVLVGSPGAVDTYYFRRVPVPKPAEAGVYNKTLGELAEIAKKVAEEEGVAFVDVHAAMMEAMTKAKAKMGQEYEFAGKDGVHPGPNGHLVMAYAFLKGLGCDGEIGTINVDLAAQSAKASEGHKILSSDSTSVEVESSRYPFCFYGNPAEASATSGVIQFMPFNDELNRFMLVVKNAPEKSKVTWGSASKEFSREQLEKGINLAAEFIEGNPFSEAFSRGEAAIKQQQNWETPAVKDLLHRMPQYRELVPEQKKSFEKIVEAVVKKDKELQAGAASAVKPVKHTIRIEAVK